MTQVIIRTTPNRSPRPSGLKPIYLVPHQTEGSFDGAVSWLCNPEAKASADRVVSKDGARVAVLNRVNSGMYCWAVGTGNPYVAVNFECETYVDRATNRRVPFQGYQTLADQMKAAQKAVQEQYGITIPLRLSRFKGDPGIASHGQVAKWYGGSDHFTCGSALDIPRLLTLLGSPDRKWVVRSRGKVYGRYVTLRQAFRATRKLFGRGRRNVTISKES